MSNQSTVPVEERSASGEALTNQVGPVGKRRVSATASTVVLEENEHKPIAAKTPELVQLADLVEEPPFSTLLQIEEDTLASISDDMRRNGCDPSHPIHIWRKNRRNILVDGYTRVSAAKALGNKALPAFIHAFPDENAALDFAIRCQVNRRNIKDAQLVSLVRIFDQKVQPGSTQTRVDGKFAPKASDDARGKTAKATADLFGTSTTKIERVRRVLEHATPEIKLKLDNGKLTINAAVEEIKRLSKAVPQTAKNNNRDSTDGKYAPFVELPTSDLAFAHWPIITQIQGDLTGNPAELDQPSEYTVDKDRLHIAVPAKLLKEIATHFGHRRVLVSPEIDLFSSQIPASTIREILKAAGNVQDFEFLFTTRTPARLGEFTWKRNTFAGVSIYEQKDVTAAEAALITLKAPRKWVLVEQATMPLTFDHLDQLGWLVVHTRSTLHKATPTPEALVSLIESARKAKCPIFFDRGISYRPADPPKGLALSESTKKGGGADE